MKMGWLPPRSPMSLIQEDLVPNEWLVLVVCLLLNQTTRRQVEKVLPTLIELCPTPDSVCTIEHSVLFDILKPLGFGNKRTTTVIALSRAYQENWTDVRQLPGVGEYAARAYEIFCLDCLGESPPRDHALAKYWNWRKFQ